MGKQNISDFFSDVEKEHFADMKPWGYDYVARFKIDEYTLVMGMASDSEEEAMSELFKHVHRLAGEYRQMEEEAGWTDEQGRVKEMDAEQAREEA
jgi:hypothetical protein